MAKFEKGQSGNPGGRPKEVAEVRGLARLHTLDAINTLVSIMGDTDAPHNARVSAANALLDRGYGRASQAVAVEIGPAALGLAGRLDQRIAAAQAMSVPQAHDSSKDAAY